jgi:DNA-binding SARP family transcriptional activator
MESGKAWREQIRGGGASGLVRDRLTLLLCDVETYRVGLIVAPAGSGKSTLLAQMAAVHPGPVAWCEAADPIPRTESALAEWLWGAIGPALDASAPAPAPATVDELIRTVGRSGPPLLVVADDLHLIEGSPAEEALGHLVTRLPPTLRLLLASRVNLGFDLSRMRVSGDLIEITLDDLRFRTWEVEQLFGAVYREPLPPEDAAALTRRTGGWAAYLQLFHLATARKAPADRRRVLSSLDTRSHLVQEYLTHHVLAGLTDELADFLIRTSVLRRPTGPMSDELLGRTGSSDLLAELERRQVLTDRVDAHTYRYHAVLLSYLDDRLVDMIGVDGARREHQRAARLLEREGFGEDAVTAYARAEDWEGLTRLLGKEHRHVTVLGGTWLEALPPATVAADPWMLMALARRALASGSLTEAARVLRDAAGVARSSTAVARCRRERAQVNAWLSKDLSAGTDWLGLLRAATQRDPAEARRRVAGLPGAGGRFAEGMSALLSGDVRGAGRLLRGVSAQADAGPALASGARLAVLIAEGICGRAPTPEALDRLRDEVDAVGIPWLDRLIRALLGGAGPRAADHLDVLVRACRDDDDRWGEAILALFAGAAGMQAGHPAVLPFEQAAASFGDLGAGVLQTWAEAYRAIALVRAGQRDQAVRAAQQARTLAGLREVPGAAGIAALVLGAVQGDGHHAAWAAPVLEPLGLWESHRALVEVAAPGAIPWAAPTAAGATGTEALAAASAPAVSVPAPTVPASSEPAPDQPPADVPAATRLRCLGGFTLIIDGRPVDDSVAKPMERAALHVLAMRAGESVHREQLMEMLWPGADRDAGLHRLQVAVSALRRLLESNNGGRPRYLLRDGDAYRLVLPPEAEVDLWELRDSLSAAATARSSGDVDAEASALAAALSAYGGSLLPGDGPAEWVIGPRAAAQAAAAGAAGRLAELRLAAGDSAGAGDAARTGRWVDRFRDDLWKLSIRAAEQADHQAEAGQLRAAYQAVLAEMGIPSGGSA